MPTQKKAFFADTTDEEDQTLASSERKRKIDRRQAVLDLIEQNSMLDTVDDIYRKAKVDSQAKVNKIAADVFDILKNGQEPMSLVGLVAEKEMRDEETIQENIRLQADKQMLEGSAVEVKQQRMKELEELSRRYNIKIQPPTNMPP